MAHGFEWNGKEVGVARVAEHLRTEGFYVTAFEGRRSFMVEARPMYPGVPSSVKFLLWDNGGEWGVERVNSGELARFVPTCWFGCPRGPLIMLARVLAVLRGEEVDWQMNLDEQPQAVAS